MRKTKAKAKARHIKTDVTFIDGTRDESTYEMHGKQSIIDAMIDVLMHVADEGENVVKSITMQVGEGRGF